MKNINNLFSYINFQSKASQFSAVFYRYERKEINSYDAIILILFWIQIQFTCTRGSMETNRKGNSSDRRISIKRLGTNLRSENSLEKLSTLHRKNSMVEASSKCFFDYVEQFPETQNPIKSSFVMKFPTKVSAKLLIQFFFREFLMFNYSKLCSPLNFVSNKFSPEIKSQVICKSFRNLAEKIP